MRIWSCGEINVVRIAFWNTHKSKKINEIVSDIICENKIDIMVLAEYEDRDVWFYKKNYTGKSE